ncbi:DUF6011 domain-containing protein [Azohydromonas aeria]|uniref:DUF6011 domain-containing protein n=1 Tax=Azohydromonas aeria TaxID=2590212 RepID=UPI0012F81E34|nr:DUF6011 domain-containing protein [Azohydromonas aeria]
MTCCLICGKPLTDPVSVALKIGPVCRCQIKMAEAMDRTMDLFGPPRSTYSWTVEDGVICIVDLNGGKSVTNDAENVIADLVTAGAPVDTMPVIYRDSVGVWDELAVADSRFSTFRSVHERDKGAATAIVKARYSSGI